MGTMALALITIARADLTADASRALIEALNAELSGVYPEAGATHFRRLKPGANETVLTACKKLRFA